MAKDHSPAFLDLVSDAKSRIEEIEPKKLKEKLENGEIKLIDVREDHEYKYSHVEGAEHMSKGVIERDIEEKVPEKDTPLALYCGGGYRSALAADALQKMGYENVYSVAGGFRALKREEFPMDE